MDRLTIKDESGAYHLKASKACAGDIPSKRVITNILGKYEDTGLTPEEVEELKKRYFEVVVERNKLKGVDK